MFGFFIKFWNLETFLLRVGMNAWSMIPYTVEKYHESSTKILLSYVVGIINIVFTSYLIYVGTTVDNKVYALAVIMYCSVPGILFFGIVLIFKFLSKLIEFIVIVRYFRTGNLSYTTLQRLKHLLGAVYVNDKYDWFRNGESHRWEGPARINKKGSQYYIFGSSCESIDDFLTSLVDMGMSKEIAVKMRLEND